MDSYGRSGVRGASFDSSRPKMSFDGGRQQEQKSGGLSGRLSFRSWQNPLKALVRRRSKADDPQPPQQSQSARLASSISSPSSPIVTDSFYYSTQSPSTPRSTASLPLAKSNSILRRAVSQSNLTEREQQANAQAMAYAQRQQRALTDSPHLGATVPPPRMSMSASRSAPSGFDTPRQAAKLAVQRPAPNDGGSGAGAHRMSMNIPRAHDDIAPPRKSMSAPRPDRSPQPPPAEFNEYGNPRDRDSSAGNVPPPYVPPGHQRPHGAPPASGQSAYSSQQQSLDRDRERDRDRDSRQPETPTKSISSSRDQSRGRHPGAIDPRGPRDPSRGRPSPAAGLKEGPPSSTPREQSRGRRVDPPQQDSLPRQQNSLPWHSDHQQLPTAGGPDSPRRTKSPPLPFNRTSATDLDPSATHPPVIDPTDPTEPTEGDPVIHDLPLVGTLTRAMSASSNPGAPPPPQPQQPLLRIPSTRVGNATTATSFPMLVPQRGSIGEGTGTGAGAGGGKGQGKGEGQGQGEERSFLSYMRDTLFVDAALKIENAEREIVTAPVHRIVLAQRSPFFKSLFVQTQPTELTPHGLPIFPLPILPAHKSLHAVVYRILVWTYSMSDTDPTLTGPKWDVVAGTRRLAELFELAPLKAQADALLLEVISSPATTLPDLASIGVEARKWELKDVSMLATNRLIALLREPSTADSTLSSLTAQKFGFLLDSVDPSSHFDFIRRYISVQYQAGRLLGQDERAALWLRVNFDGMPLSELEAAFLDENTPVDLVAAAAARRISSEDGAQLLTAFSPDLFYSALEAATSAARDGPAAVVTGGAPPVRVWSAGEAYKAVRTYVMNHGGLDEDIKADLWSKVDFSELTLEELTDAGEEGLAPSASLLAAMVTKLRPISSGRQGSATLFSTKSSLQGSISSDTLVRGGGSRGVRWRSSLLSAGSGDGSLVVGASGMPQDAPDAGSVLSGQESTDQSAYLPYGGYNPSEQEIGASNVAEMLLRDESQAEDEEDGPPPVPSKTLYSVPHEESRMDSRGQPRSQRGPRQEESYGSQYRDQIRRERSAERVDSRSYMAPQQYSQQVQQQYLDPQQGHRAQHGRKVSGGSVASGSSYGQGSYQQSGRERERERRRSQMSGDMVDVRAA
ncbi:hypothetical protein M427DRAFT_135638 [Gonapodya prolifera JEL478]|uniref:BTB domain-containing protein n=1 Tax=Gonapodya prolifera (strain JEL478) TaxID=1344416 RepID=A0A139AD61_GONPJ|nr:hypothetical protein M427DRAFT_135638 [Gonapodya prolifera JEL478]|eukprot:KXS14752.1 hypothetical protein M427DRAFT_135638 [Gonapodya prolifera JEL478]